MGKVFISFLGTNRYKLCNYYFKQDESDVIQNVRFIQQALLKKYCLSWGKNDRALFFLTEQAEKTNWIEKEKLDIDELGEEIHGLLYHLTQLELTLSIEPIYNIPKGNNESEIWQLFELITEKINSLDEIYLDITHGFRSLPMLGLVLINYLKVTKRIRVGGIFYGAFENLGPAYKVEKIPLDKRNAPVIDLGSFHILQNWIIGADNFINYGITGKIDQAISEETAPVIRKTKGSDPKTATLKDFQKSLNDLAPAFQTLRGKEIVEGEKIQDIKEKIRNIEKFEQLGPLKNILDKISEKLSSFRVNSIENGFAGVQWCIDHEMIQQGITFLQENTVSWVLTSLDLDYTDQLHRDLVNQAFHIVARNLAINNWRPPSRDYPELAAEIQAFIKKTGLTPSFNSLSDFRNDINHGGFTVKRKPGGEIQNPRDSKEFKKCLTKKFQAIKKLIFEFESAQTTTQ